LHYDRKTLQVQAIRLWTIIIYVLFIVIGNLFSFKKEKGALTIQPRHRVIHQGKERDVD